MLLTSISLSLRRFYGTIGIMVNITENITEEKRLKKVFAGWIENGHNDFDDKNCIILKIRLTNGTLFSHGTKYEIDFT